MLKNSVLISCVRFLLRVLDTWYQGSILHGILGNLGQVFSCLLGGTFLAHLSCQLMEDAHLSRGIQGLYTKINKRKKVKEFSCLKESLLYQYIDQFRNFQGAFRALGMTLFLWGLGVFILYPGKKAFFILGFGVFLFILSLALKNKESSLCYRLLLWGRDLVYEEEDHDPI